MFSVIDPEERYASTAEALRGISIHWLAEYDSSGSIEPISGPRIRRKSLWSAPPAFSQFREPLDW